MLGRVRRDWNTSPLPPGVVKMSIRLSVAPSLLPALPNDDAFTTTSDTGTGASWSVTEIGVGWSASTVTRVAWNPSWLTTSSWRPVGSSSSNRPWSSVIAPTRSAGTATLANSTGAPLRPTTRPVTVAAPAAPATSSAVRARMTNAQRTSGSLARVGFRLRLLGLGQQGVAHPRVVGGDVECLVEVVARRRVVLELHRGAAGPDEGVVSSPIRVRRVGRCRREALDGLREQRHRAVGATTDEGGLVERIDPGQQQHAGVVGRGCQRRLRGGLDVRAECHHGLRAEIERHPEQAGLDRHRLCVLGVELQREVSLFEAVHAVTLQQLLLLLAEPR